MTSRVLLLCVDDSEASEDAVKWTLDNICKDGDELHFVHVIPRFHLQLDGVPPADFLAHHDTQMYEEMIKKAESFIARRFLVHVDEMAEAASPPVVHIIKFETDSDSIGTVLCKKAEELNASVLVVARRDKSKLQQFFLGSVSSFCLEHSKRPVLVHH
jgi:nucleotide-binding universal stress UspA family protein